MITRPRENDMASTRQQIIATQKKSESNYMKTLVGGYHQYSWVRGRKKDEREGGKEERKEEGRKGGWMDSGNHVTQAPSPSKLTSNRGAFLFCICCGVLIVTSSIHTSKIKDRY